MCLKLDIAQQDVHGYLGLITEYYRLIEAWSTAGRAEDDRVANRVKLDKNDALHYESEEPTNAGYNGQ